MALKSILVTLNGQQYTAVLNENTGKYEATITAPEKSSYNQDGHFYDVSVTATDDAGNSTSVNSTDDTLGEALQLRVKELVAPVITITSPTSDQITTNNTPTITFTVTDDDSGVNADTITVYVDGTPYTADITKTPITGGYECSYTVPEALNDGVHSVFIEATDNDENKGTTATINFTVDTVPPVLSVTSPVEGLVTNQSVVTVIGTTNDATSSPVTLTINGEEVTVNEDGSFSHDVTLVAGENTITIVATDAAGKSSTVTRVVEYNTTAPVITNVEITPNPVNAGSVFTISITVSDE